MGPRNIIFAFVLGSAMAAGIFVATKTSKPAIPEAAFVLPLPSALPEFSLLDQSGNTVDAGTFRGQWDLVFFGFTNCPDICPTTMQVLATARQELAAAGTTSLPRIVLVSVDPERDTPELLGQYVDHFGEGNLAVTGELDEVVKLTVGLSIYFEKAPLDGDNYSVDHSGAVLVIDPNGEFSALFSGPQRIGDYVHDLPILMSSN